jgi:heme-degrading monooxygenase HmoA
MLVHYPRHAIPRALLHMALDRLDLRRTAGLRFWRLLGSSAGLAAGRWDPQRYGLFTVWDTAAALDTFEVQSPVLARYRRVADEMWTVRLVPVRWHGAWGGCDPFAGIEPPKQLAPGPWVILTRATIRLRHVRTFTQAAARVTATLANQPGLIASIGLGEMPFVLQATVSLWQDLPSFQTFAYDRADHREVVKRTRTEGWYHEELFARFQPIAAYGTWDGVDPLATSEYVQSIQGN